MMAPRAEAMHGSGANSSRFGPTSATHRRRLVPFANVGGRAGVFCVGLRPLWVELAAPLAPPRFHEHVRCARARVCVRVCVCVLAQIR